MEKTQTTSDFCCFIISHGRADKVKTLKTLTASKYTGPVFVICDNEDQSVDKYKQKFGDDMVIVFDKQKYADATDECNNFDDRRTTTHARNACFDIAEELGYTYFMVLDDDYTSFRYRYISKYITKGTVKDFDKLLSSMLKFYKATNFASIAFAQGGDFIGGADCGLLTNYRNVSRKCMNSFLCSTERRFKFIGQLNEDVNTYVTLGSRGVLFLTIPYIGLEQVQTQRTSGGMTDAYKLHGTYVKSFTTVMLHPSSVKVSLMGFKQNRLHHKIDWPRTTPMIISEQYKQQS